MALNRAAMGVVSIEQLSFASLFDDRPFVPFQDGFEVQIFIDGAYAEGDHLVAVATVQELAVAQYSVAERWRGLVQDSYIHIVCVQELFQIADEFQASIEALPRIGLASQQHSKIHIRKGVGLAARLRSIQVCHNDFSLRSEVSLQS